MAEDILERNRVNSTEFYLSSKSWRTKNDFPFINNHHEVPMEEFKTEGFINIGKVSRQIPSFLTLPEGPCEC